MLNCSLPSVPTKIIIDVDPGIDGAMAIFMALRSPEVEVVGITTIFGSTHTPVATRNALHLLEIIGSHRIPVAQGSAEPLAGGAPCIQDSRHGPDGLGTVAPAEPETEAIGASACDFLLENILKHPGKITIVALGPLTNLAQVAHVVVLGGAFFSSGDVNPASEANMISDPEAADIVFSSGARVTVIGINLTSQVVLEAKHLSELADSPTGFQRFLYEMCRFYKEWHKESAHLDGIYLDGPTCLAAVISPPCFSYRTGCLRVETMGLCRGHTLFDMGLKKWNGVNPWIGRPHVDVAWTVDAATILELVRERLIRTDNWYEFATRSFVFSLIYNFVC